jgi:hypothetical protein
MNRVFGLVMEESDARSYAERMLSQLRRKDPVFVSSLVVPEREILNQLYHLLDPATSIDQIRLKNLTDFRSSFPEFRIVTIPLVTNGSLQIYQLQSRNYEP